MSQPTSVDQSLADEIINRVETIVTEAETSTKPLELDPYRGQLFELFVLAEASGCVEDDAEPDLSADGIGRQLALRWNLASVTQDAFVQQEKLASPHLSKMRLLWSFMRMWMEWSYAWQRWPEFHDGPDAG